MSVLCTALKQISSAFYVKMKYPNVNNYKNVCWNEYGKVFNKTKYVFQHLDYVPHL